MFIAECSSHTTVIRPLPSIASPVRIEHPLQQPQPNTFFDGQYRGGFNQDSSTHRHQPNQTRSDIASSMQFRLNPGPANHKGPQNHYAQGRSSVQYDGGYGKVGHEHPPQQVHTLPEVQYHGEQYCQACQKIHSKGYCQLKLAGPDSCGLCGITHFGVSRTCPNFSSDVQIRLMLDALRKSQESPEKIEGARMYLRGILAERVRRKKL